MIDLRLSRVLSASAVVLLGAAVPASAVPDNEWRIVITEIMYNPASDESSGQTEWVEIANLGSDPVEITNWRLDDEDDQDWGQFSCTIEPGGVVVLINSDAVTEDEFRAAWDENPGSAEPTYHVIGVTWGSLANSASASNEILQLLDEHDDIVCEVNYQSGGDWPDVRRPDGSSIWLSDLSATDLNKGEVWKRSEAGLDGARKATATPIFSAADVGSPGFVAGLGDFLSSRTAEGEASPAEDAADGSSTEPEPEPEPEPDDAGA